MDSISPTSRHASKGEGTVSEGSDLNQIVHGYTYNVSTFIDIRRQRCPMYYDMYIAEILKLAFNTNQSINQSINHVI